MRASMLAPFILSVACALPQDTPSCTTTTVEVIIPTTTATYTDTAVETITATTPLDQGTFTDFTTISSTRTIHTFTTTSTDCTASATITVAPSTTVYTMSSSPPAYKRALGLAPRQDEDCTITETFTTTVGQTQTYVTAPGITSTYTRYSQFTYTYVTSTAYDGTAYTVATATTTTSTACGPASTATDSPTSTTVQDARCAPSAIVSAAGGSDGNQFGINYLGTNSGASYFTNATDASACCQLCVEAGDCAASAWDVRDGRCRLVFTAAYDTGAISCGNQLIIAYYDAGPNSPMVPGSGLFVGDLCNTVGYFNAEPDDGT